MNTPLNNLACGFFRLRVNGVRLTLLIPTVYREPYLEGLRILSREGNPAPFIESMCAAQSWAAAFSYADLREVVDAMEKCNAFDENSRTSGLVMPGSGM